jgi:hypothetical protein
VSPPFDVPDEKLNAPLTPAAPEFIVYSVSAPLLVAEPYPDATVTTPPVLTVLSPADTATLPPAPVLPLPTEIVTAPPLPPVAAPEPIEIAPDAPPLDVPDEKLKPPLTPLTPAFTVCTVSDPLPAVTP